MPKETTRPQEITQPMKMEVKVLIPWMIITVMVASFAGLWFGWTLRSGQVAEVNAAVATVKSELTVKK